MKSLLFWIAFPFLIPQALYVRSTAPRFAPAGGPKEGYVGDGDEVHLLALGDSMIAGVGASELSRALVGQTARALAGSRRCRVAWRAVGVSGYDSAKVLEYLVPGLPDQTFDFVVVSVGVNDVTGLTTTRRWRRNLSRLLQALHVRYPMAKIALAGLPPMHGFPLLPQPLRAVFGMRAQTFDEIAREVAVANQNAFNIPIYFEPDPEKFSPDGYHPSEESYVEFGQHMAERLVD